MKNRGQGTTEYLIILAVIIIIALVVAGVMGWFPGLGGAITEQQSKAYWQGTSPIAVTDWQIGGSSGTTKFTLKNVGTDSLVVNSIKVGNQTHTPTNNVTINAGETKVIDANGDIYCSAGQNTYQYDMIIDYNVVGGISGKKLVGAKPIVGTCG